MKALCIKSLTGEPGRSSPEPALLHPLSVEEPVAHLTQELVELRAGGVDQFRPGAAQHGPAEPQRQTGGHGGGQGAEEAEEAGQGEDELLLPVWHDGMKRSRDAGLRLLQEPRGEAQRRAWPHRSPPPPLKTTRHTD